MHDLWKCEQGLKSYSAFRRDYLMRQFDLDCLEVAYSLQFQTTGRGPTTDICLDDVETR